MKNLKKNAIIMLSVSAMGAFPLLAQVSTTCGNNGQKVLVCHIPPGNPMNAHTLCISPNAVDAHMQGSNQHHDFLGDCWGGCLGMSVVEVNQGKQSNGTSVPADRSDVTKVLGTPDMVNAPGQFYSLGFGGSITIQMDGFILNRPGNDIMISETTFGPRSCASYPERAEIAVSPDMVSWETVGEICQDGAVDIGSFDFIRFVKITDISKASDFGTEVVDGYDVDGIQCIPYTPARLANNADVIDTHEQNLNVYPNPVESELSLYFDGIEVGQTIQLSMLDQTGRVVYTQTITPQSEIHQTQIEMKQLNAGIYMLQVLGENYNQTHKIVKK